MTGFEPAASCSQSRRATKLRYIPMISIKIAYRFLPPTESFNPKINKTPQDLCMKPQRGPNQDGVRSQNWRLQDLPGLSDEQQKQLWNYGIQTTLQLYHQTNTPAKRDALARHLQLHPQYISKWAAMADLARVPAIGCHYCGLLLHAGIASPQQLALMPVHRVHRQLLRFQVAQLQRPDLCPSLEEVQIWIEQSQQLKRPDPPTLNRDTRTSP
jgi:hypothetical protein